MNEIANKRKRKRARKIDKEIEVYTEQSQNVFTINYT